MCLCHLSLEFLPFPRREGVGLPFLVEKITKGNSGSSNRKSVSPLQGNSSLSTITFFFSVILNIFSKPFGLQVTKNINVRVLLSTVSEHCTSWLGMDTASVNYLG